MGLTLTFLGSTQGGEGVSLTLTCLVLAQGGAGGLTITFLVCPQEGARVFLKQRDALI